MSASVIQLARDGLYSLIGKLGVVGQDKAASTIYGAPLMTEAELLNAYRGSWLARKIIDIPALDSCRKWRAWQAEEDQIGLIEAEETRLGVRSKVLEARTKARLFGGAAIYISTGDARPEEEFNPDRVGKGGIRFLNVMLPRHVQAGEIENDPESQNFGKPAFYTLTTQARGQVRIHPSRLVIFTGAPHVDPELSPIQSNSWGDSVLVSTLQAIKNADATAGNVARLIFEAKIDIIKMNGLMERFAEPGYEDRVVRRYELAAMQKDVNGFLLMDTEEEYEQKSTSFSQLPELMDRFVQLCAGAADIPVTRLLGMSPAGMNSTGEHDTRNYYDRISSSQELEMKPAMALMDEAIIRSALGSRPPELHYIWASLWQVSDKERSEIGEKIANTIDKLNGTGLYPQEALANAGANALVEASILPGFIEAIEEAGGLPDYEMLAEEEAEAERIESNDYNPNQPRHPAGSSVGGQWIGGGSSVVSLSSRLTEQQSVDLTDYKDGGYRGLNGYLRNPESASKLAGVEYERQAKRIDAAIKKSSLTEDVTVYRGIRHAGLSKNAERLIGHEVSVASFQSTSLDKAVARDFVAWRSDGVIFQIKARKGTKAVDMSAFESRNNAGEKELLFGRGIALKVTRVDRSGSQPVIHGEFVPSKKMTGDIDYSAYTADAGKTESRFCYDPSEADGWLSAASAQNAV